MKPAYNEKFTKHVGREGEEEMQELVVHLTSQEGRTTRVSLGLRCQVWNKEMRDVQHIVDRALGLGDEETALLYLKDLDLQLPRSIERVGKVIWKNRLQLTWKKAPKLNKLPSIVEEGKTQDLFCMVVGQRGSGRTTMLHELGRQIVANCEEKRVRFIVVDPLASQDPLHVGKKWSWAVGKKGKRVEMVVYSSYDSDVVMQVCNNAKEEFKREEEAHSEVKEGKEGWAVWREERKRWRKRHGIKRVVVLDNCNCRGFWKSEGVRMLAMNGRRYRIPVLLSTSFVYSIPPAIRGNVDFAFAFWTNSTVNLKYLWKNFFGFIRTFKEFKHLMECWCLDSKNWTALVAKNTAMFSKLEDNLFTMQACRERLFPITEAIKLVSHPLSQAVGEKECVKGGGKGCSEGGGRDDSAWESEKGSLYTLEKGGGESPNSNLGTPVAGLTKKHASDTAPPHLGTCADKNNGDPAY